MREPCKICHTETKSICYKLYVCGACTMFYRRNYRFWGRLSCRMNGNCNLKADSLSDRRTCRACRLKACRDLGLRMIGKSLVVQQDGLPEDDILEPEENTKNCNCQKKQCCSKNNVVKEEDNVSLPSSNEASPHNKTDISDQIHSPSTSNALLMQQQSNDCASTMLARSVAISMVDQEPYPRTAFRPFSQFQHELGNRFYELDRYPQLTHLRHVVEIFKRLIDRQRAIAQDTLNLTVESEPEPPVQPPAQVLSMQFPVMERQMVTFSCMSIVEFLHGCEGLSIDEKVQIMKPTMLDVSLIFKMYLTVRRYPEMGDPRLAMFTGISNDLSKYDLYMSDLFTVLGADAYMKHYNKSKALVEPFYKKMIGLMDRFRDFKPCIVEIATLACMTVYERMENVEIQHVLAMRLRDKVCAELSVYLSDQYPQHIVSVRMMRLASLLYASRRISEDYEDMFSLLGVLIPENRHQDFQNMPSVVPETMHKLAVDMEPGTSDQTAAQ